LGWSHFKLLIPIKQTVKREFYAEMCRVHGWSTRALTEKLDGMLYERTALSKKPAQLIRQELASLRDHDELTPARVFQDPYMLDFLELKDTYSEKDLESALLREIERFLLELGAGFAFVERQKRIVLDGDDYYIEFVTALIVLQRFCQALGSARRFSVISGPADGVPVLFAALTAPALAALKVGRRGVEGSSRWRGVDQRAARDRLLAERVGLARPRPGMLGSCRAFHSS
jgi:predicted nuclease of restriction endonuclease-like (RecB) superfamily